MTNIYIYIFHDIIDFIYIRRVWAGPIDYLDVASKVFDEMSLQR